MKNFIFKSTEADLKKIFQYLDTGSKNILYLTFQTDKILKIVKDLENMGKMQKKIEEFYDKTSPQTDTVNKEDSDWEEVGHQNSI